MKKKETIKEVMEKAEVQVQKKKREIKTFADTIVKRIDMKCKNIKQFEFFEIRNNILNELNKLEKLLAEEKIREKQEKTLHKILSKYSDEEIKNYLNNKKEVK